VDKNTTENISVSMRFVQNRRRSTPHGDTFGDERPWTFHRRLPGYAPTPLKEAAELAQRLDVAHIWVKDESQRFRMPAFKILGTSWAVYKALTERSGVQIAAWNSLAELAEQFAPLRPLTLVAATDGNHGRAVAHMARLLGFEAHIIVPSDMAPSRIEAIKGEGARVTLVNDTYDDAVKCSREIANEDKQSLIVSDTSWSGYEAIPRWVIEGYTTMFKEVDEELALRHQRPPDLIIVQMGVGSLAAAVVQHYSGSTSPIKIVGIEPTTAACVLTSIEAGSIVSLVEPPQSKMVGLNCGTPSLVAWPMLSSGIDAFATIEDEWTYQGMRELAAIGVVAGETGAAGLGGLLSLLTDVCKEEIRRILEVDTSSNILVFATEGATDPTTYARIVHG
jgi:diaminopropionate ammonia-lyase